MISKRSLLLTGWLAVAVSSALGGTERRFEVASIKAGKNPNEVSMHRDPGGRFGTGNTNLKTLIAFAYSVRDHQIVGGPGWLGSDPWDVNAKPEGVVPEGPAGLEVVREMMRTLLAERFGLVLRRESKEAAVYALVEAKGGAKLKQAPEGTKGSNSRMEGLGQLKLVGGLSLFAAQLSSITGRPVNDETGLTGAFDIALKWMPDAAQLAQMGGGAGGGGAVAEGAAGEGPSIFTALQEQLGLRLESRKGQVVLYVVEKAAKPTEN